VSDATIAEAALEVKGVTKRYASEAGDVRANEDVHLTVHTGALHAIVGENGAGKSTLAHIIAGITRPDSGSIDVFGQTLRLGIPRESRVLGVGLVPQHFSLVLPMTVWENVILGDEPATFGWVDRNQARQAVTEAIQALDLRISPDDRVADLPLPSRQGVEIVKALVRKARLLILDEPTSVLGPEESKHLFALMRKLRDDDVTVLLVTHRIRDVIEHASAVTVMRHGKCVATHSRDEFDEDRIVSEIIGESRPPQETEQGGTVDGRSVLTLEDITVNTAGRGVLSSIDLTIREGQIIGVAGVDGNGQTELAMTVAGHLLPESGSIRLGDEEITDQGPGEKRAAGIAYIPEDRRGTALIEDFSIRDNLFLGGHDRFGTTWSWDACAATDAANDLITAFDIRTPSALARVDSLSGGNQQKVVLARELSRDPRVLVAAHPTQGLDLGATRFVHKRLRQVRSSGCGILVISNDIKELRAISDRILVMYRGKIAGIQDTADYDENRIGAWMTAGKS